MVLIRQPRTPTEEEYCSWGVTLALPLLPRGTATAETEAAEAARRAAMVVNILKVWKVGSKLNAFVKRECIEVVVEPKSCSSWICVQKE